MKRANGRIATLNAQENHSWEFAFAYYLQSGLGEKQADELAWADLAEEFPRLKKFQGCR
jgi:hypothetical protein